MSIKLFSNTISSLAKLFESLKDISKGFTKIGNSHSSHSQSHANQDDEKYCL